MHSVAFFLVCLGWAGSGCRALERPELTHEGRQDAQKADNTTPGESPSSRQDEASRPVKALATFLLISNPVARGIRPAGLGAVKPRGAPRLEATTGVENERTYTQFKGKEYTQNMGHDGMLEMLEEITAGLPHKGEERLHITKLVDHVAAGFPNEGVKVSKSAIGGIIELTDHLADWEPEASIAPRKNSQREELLNFENILDILKADARGILRKELDYSIFAQDFKVIDQTGRAVQGLSANKQLFKFLRRLCETFAVSNDVQVEDEHEIIITQEDGGVLDLVVGGAELEVRLKVQLQTGYRPSAPTVDMELETVFHLNEKRQLDYVQIGKWLVNGRPFELWPDMTLVDAVANPGKIMQRFQAVAAEVAVAPQSPQVAEDGGVVGKIFDQIKGMVQPTIQEKPVSPELARFRKIKNAPHAAAPKGGPLDLVGHDAPDFEINFIGGEKKMLSSLIADGKPIVLDFYMNF